YTASASRFGIYIQRPPAAVRILFFYPPSRRDCKGRKVFRKNKNVFFFFPSHRPPEHMFPKPNVPFPPSRSGAKVETLDIYSNRSPPFLSRNSHNTLED